MEEDILQELMKLVNGSENEQHHPPPQQPPQEEGHQQDEQDVDAKLLEELRRNAGDADMHKSSRQLAQELQYLLGEE